MSQLTQVFYIIPEDHDDYKQPNCFLIYKHADKITLADIRKSFPVPGDYFFRFQFVHQRHLIWLDITNESCKLPRVDGAITVKATRQSWHGESKPVDQDIGTYFQEEFLKQEEAIAA